jgi:hypothetical protein
VTRVIHQVQTRKNDHDGVSSCTPQFRTPSRQEPHPKLSIGRRPNPRGYARSDRRSANCLNPQLRASSDATAHVGAWSAREGSGADASMVAIDR